MDAGFQIKFGMTEKYMRISAIIFLVLGLASIGLQIIFAYLPPPVTIPCEGALCMLPVINIEKRPGFIVPFWLPPVSVLAWLASLIEFWRKKYGASLIIAILSMLFLLFVSGARIVEGVYSVLSHPDYWRN